MRVVYYSQLDQMYIHLEDAHENPPHVGQQALWGVVQGTWEVLPWMRFDRTQDNKVYGIEVDGPRRNGVDLDTARRFCELLGGVWEEHDE